MAKSGQGSYRPSWPAAAGVSAELYCDNACKAPSYRNRRRAVGRDLCDEQDSRRGSSRGRRVRSARRGGDAVITGPGADLRVTSRNVDWVKSFALDTPPLEILVRGTVIYLALYALLRVVLKRETGITSMTDLLAVVLIADAAQNGMSGAYTSITDGLLLVAVIIGWSFLLNWMAHRWRWASRIIRPRPLLVIRDGELLSRSLRKELITEEQLREQARKQGIEELADVREGWMESDGQFSFITGQAAGNSDTPSGG